jgi:myo-inositol 2-dehydrogenase/D-chiro-inositol 1-dehydrogenase
VTEPLRVGIVGCGRVTQTWHAPALAALEEVEVVAVADPLEQPRVRVAAALRARAYDGHAALLEDDGVDAVAVCTPAGHHAEVVHAALAAGRHVFVEKPLCVALEDARSLAAAAAGSDRTVAVGFNLRHHELVRRAAALIASGGLGEVVALQSVFSSNFDYRAAASPWRFRREHGGGAVFEMASHHFDLWRLLLADELEEVFAVASSGEDDDETAVVAARTRAGVAISFLVTQRSGHLNECTVHGTRGTLRLSPYRHDGLELVPAGEFAGAPRLRLRRALESAWALRRGRAPFARSYRAEWLRFAEAARAGRRLPDVEDGVRNVEVLRAVLRSAEDGVPARP